MELIDIFYQEGQKFNSILRTSNAFVCLKLKENDANYSLNLIEKFFTGEDFIVGFRVEIKNKVNVVTTYIIRDKHKHVNIEERANLCALFAKFNNKLILNG